MMGGTLAAYRAKFAETPTIDAYAILCGTSNIETANPATRSDGKSAGNEYFPIQPRIGTQLTARLTVQ